MENYIVKKLVSGTVGYVVPGETRTRMWKNADARQRVPFDELEKCAFDADARRLFERGYLFIEDKDCRIKLGYEDEDPTLNVDNKLILDSAQINTLLYIESFEAFKKKVEKLAEGSIELLIETAITTSKQLTVEKSDFIRRKYHVDVDKIHRDKRDEGSKEG